LSPQRRRRPLRRMSPQRRSARSRPMRRSSEGSTVVPVVTVPTT
jgi:hypothetical protein